MDSGQNRAQQRLIVGLFAALLWSINHDYNNAFTKWFVVHFPDEARTMGIEFPVD